jgi:Rieske Fe-S protein
LVNQFGRQHAKPTWDAGTAAIDEIEGIVKDENIACEFSVRAVKRGEGKILKRGGKKLAVYRDDCGRVKKMSTVCTHMGCLVRWNQADATWDCSCHGSRFSPTGKVLGGPAETPLSSA